MNKSLINHYDSLIDENNDPLQDTPALRAYMDKWDGQAFFEMLALSSNQKVLEIGCARDVLPFALLLSFRHFSE